MTPPPSTLSWDSSDSRGIVLAGWCGILTNINLRMGLRCKETWSGEAGYLSRMRKHVSPAPVARKHGQKFLIALVIVLAGTHRLDKNRKYTVSILPSNKVCSSQWTSFWSGIQTFASQKQSWWFEPKTSTTYFANLTILTREHLGRALHGCNEEFGN